MSLLSPHRPVLRNGNPLLKFLGNAFTGERILQRPASYPTSSMGNRPAENVLPNLPSTTVVPGSWVYEQRGQQGQPNEAADCGSARCLRGICVYDFVQNTLPRVHEHNRDNRPISIPYRRVKDTKRVLGQFAIRIKATARSIEDQSQSRVFACGRSSLIFGAPSSALFSLSLSLGLCVCFRCHVGTIPPIYPLKEVPRRPCSGPRPAPRPPRETRRAARTPSACARWTTCCRG